MPACKGLWTDAETVDEFRELFALRRGKAPEFSGLTAGDRTCNCAGCKRLLLAEKTTGSRRKGTVPVEATKINERPYCPSCIRRMGASA